MAKSFSSSRVSPPQMLVLGFVVTILAGTGLLLMPYSTTGGISFTDAFFTSTSAVCVTGLIVRNTPADFTMFGKTIIMLLIQVGGLGYMSMATFIALIAGKRIGMTHRIMIKESMNIATHEGVVRFIKGMLTFVVLAEVSGALFLYLRFMTEYDLKEALFMSVFHSVSAFNNAGFSLFEQGLAGYRGDVLMNLVIMLLVVLGGIGFAVVGDVYGRFSGSVKKLMLHTRIVLLTTLVLIVAGAALFYISERNYLFLHASSDNVITSLFASVTARTAGFNTIDYSMLQPATLFLTILLMFIGASPGSTGGGIKTTTFSIVILHLWSTVRGRQETAVFGKTIPAGLISKSFVILSLAVIYVNLVTFVIVDIEHTDFMKTFFEVISAFATVGLSTGDGGARSFCAGFSDISKYIIIITMLAGRLGPLTLFMALTEQKEQRIKYPEGKVMIG